MRALTLACLLCVICFPGCGPEDNSTEEEYYEAPVLEAPANQAKADPNLDELLKELGANEKAKGQKIDGKIRLLSLYDAGVTDLSPLEGLELFKLDLTHCPVSDLSPLEGMPLEELYLEGSRVTDLSPLKGMPLKILRMEHTPVRNIKALAGMSFAQLNLYDTKVESIEGVENMTLGTLWIPETKVSDLEPLRGKSLESLDIAKTPVKSLEPIRGMVSLRRLNIENSAVTDLTPLEGLQLRRLIFTPSKIEKGIDVVRNMPSLTQLWIHSDFQGKLLPADEFWARYDAGTLE